MAVNLLAEAEKEFKAKVAFDQFFNTLYGPDSEFARLSDEEKVAFLNSPDFHKIKVMMNELETLGAQGYSGKINIRIPKTLHARLVTEAELEGTSLNQLIVAKLSRPL
ncbi:putative HicB family RNase H-like nuclease [Hydrogenispora ethanolica]|jgi:predicted HicB family RNase H-like nuclease|uniref:Putative HicB family RNase H-like nuclease n=1 Tax=Hydrogenispora ethanolica TaxID=1082276 RepID=A0A4R1S7K3_HYDET|nr:toxin-antitoxin system HicB family antitoxin [Hydrogenispora ethanolica]TCL75318.1 putative HicB family RNase H-like nuclease [Hydrogenispora ethanolica]